VRKLFRSRVVRWSLLALAVILAVWLGRPAWHIARVLWRERFQERYDPSQLATGVVDDASRSNQTSVKRVWQAPPDRDEAERQLVEIVKQAARDGSRIAIAGARHTMGGHTQIPDGIVLDMSGLEYVSLDAPRKRLLAGAGARWSALIPLLDREGLSVGVMQSNHDFSIGGSLGANCHGWQPRRPPIASTVRSLRVVKADGSVVVASRQENRELFSLIQGGYGLFGIVTEVELELVDNERYRAERFETSVADYPATWRREVAERSDVGMAFGRISVAPDGFLSAAMLSVFRRESGPIPKLEAPGHAWLKRAIFRGGAGSEYGKNLRWKLERSFSEQVGGDAFSRNQLLFESAGVYSDVSKHSTDILHEYFVPPEEFAGFVADLARIVKKHGADLMNVTVRDVMKDDVGFLTYADRDLLSLVLSFNQARTVTADENARALTRELVDAALAHRGRHYLPYRLHATREQLRKGYPQLERFFQKKRELDPAELFQNRFYQAYAKP
jgi:FAD/FMN-containing dehydrogenase